MTTIFADIRIVGDGFSVGTGPIAVEITGNPGLTQAQASKAIGEALDRLKRRAMGKDGVVMVAAPAKN